MTAWKNSHIEGHIVGMRYKCAIVNASLAIVQDIPECQLREGQAKEIWLYSTVLYSETENSDEEDMRG